MCVLCHSMGPKYGAKWWICVLCHSVWTVCGAQVGDLCLMSQRVDSMWGPGGGSVSYVTAWGQKQLGNSIWTVCGALVGVLCLMSQWVDSMWGPGGGSVPYVTVGGQYVGPRWGIHAICHIYDTRLHCRLLIKLLQLTFLLHSIHKNSDISLFQIGLFINNHFCKTFHYILDIK